jgi:hypothetical protein
LSKYHTFVIYLADLGISDYHKTEQFAERKKMRGQIESKNAEMKQAHDMQKAKHVGLFGSVSHDLLVNVKRMLKLLKAKAAKSWLVQNIFPTDAKKDHTIYDCRKNMVFLNILNYSKYVLIIRLFPYTR